MPLDGLTMGFLCREMQSLTGGRIDRVFQPEKDMLILGIRTQGRNERLLISASPGMSRFHLTRQTYPNPPDAPMFCMLMRKYLLGGHILSIRQLYGDRLIQILIDNRDELGESGTRELYFEAMGRHSNLTLVMNGKIIDAIRHVSLDMSRVRQMLPGLPFELPPRQDKLPPEDCTAEGLKERITQQSGSFKKALQGAVSGLSPMSAGEMTLRVTNLENPDCADLKLEEILPRLSGFLTRLDSLYAPVLLENEAGERVDFFPFPYFSCPAEGQKRCETLSDALDRFYTGRDRIERMAQKSASLKHIIKNTLEKDEKKLALQEDALLEAAGADGLRLRGELLSAQLYKVQKGQREVTLDNYYDENGGTITVSLDETLSPSANAQRYFKRYRKALAARKTAQAQKQKTLAEIELLENALLNLPNCETAEDLADIRRELEEWGIVRQEKGKGKPKKAPLSMPYKYESSDGMLMLVGKNSAQNERLVRDAHGEDLWLHAKDMPGSHVLVHPEGREIPQTTLLQAAQLAAYYSKGHGQSVAVDYTRRKFVKKPAGTPQGFVIFTGNKTMLVTATDADIRKIKRLEK